MSKNGVRMLYTDRHAYTASAKWRGSWRPVLANMLDWDILCRHDFARNDAYPDKMERYQAEALAHRHIPPAALLGIGCASPAVSSAIDSQLRAAGLALKVVVRPEVVFLMIRYTQGNLLAAEAEALVNTVNTVGISGKGIALMFKENYPENFRAYEAACKAEQLTPGSLFITERHDMLGPRFMVKFATKKHWRQPSRLEWIRHGLAALRHEVENTRHPFPRHSAAGRRQRRSRLARRQTPDRRSAVRS